MFQPIIVPQLQMALALSLPSRAARSQRGGSAARHQCADRLIPRCPFLHSVAARDLLGHAGNPAPRLQALALEVPLPGVEGRTERHSRHPVPRARPAEALLAAAPALEGPGQAQGGVARLGAVLVNAPVLQIEGPAVQRDGPSRIGRAAPAGGHELAQAPTALPWP